MAVNEFGLDDSTAALEISFLRKRVMASGSQLAGARAAFLKLLSDWTWRDLERKEERKKRDENRKFRWSRYIDQ